LDQKIISKPEPITLATAILLDKFYSAIFEYKDGNWNPNWGRSFQDAEEHNTEILEEIREWQTEEPAGRG